VSQSQNRVRLLIHMAHDHPPLPGPMVRRVAQNGTKDHSEENQVALLSRKRAGETTAESFRYPVIIDASRRADSTFAALGFLGQF
jgi:hypothetical protein